jgi:hypothetical protein
MVKGKEKEKILDKLRRVVRENDERIEKTISKIVFTLRAQKKDFAEKVALITDAVLPTQTNAADAQVDAQVDAEFDAQADAQVDAQADAQVDDQADAQVDAQADAQVDAEFDAQADAQVDDQADAEFDAQADAQVNAQADAITFGEAAVNLVPRLFSDCGDEDLVKHKTQQMISGIRLYRQRRLILSFNHSTLCRAAENSCRFQDCHRLKRLCDHAVNCMCAHHQTCEFVRETMQHHKNCKDTRCRMCYAVHAIRVKAGFDAAKKKLF